MDVEGKCPEVNTPEETKNEGNETKSTVLEEKVNEGQRDGLKEENAFFKTSLCSYFRKGSCKQEVCRYAHGEEELRIRPDGTWDPTSQKAKEIQAKLKEKAKKCPSGYTLPKERLKLCVTGFPLRWKVDNVEESLKAMDITCISLKKRPGHLNAFLTFGASSEVDAAEKKLAGSKVQGRTLSVSDVKSRPWEDNGKLEENEESEDEEGELGASKEGDNPPEPVKEVWQAVTPLANIPYKDQLELKKEGVAKELRKFVHKTRKCSPPNLIPEWVREARLKGGMPCHYENILESPLKIGYRNKCEFSVGMSSQGLRTVGFQLGMFREGITAVEEPLNCQNVSHVALAFCSIFQNSIRESSLSVWDKNSNQGFWRMLTVREGRAPHGNSEKCEISSISEVMLILQICPTGVDRTEMKKEVDSVASQLATASKSHEPPLPLTVIMVQEHVGISNAASPDCPLWPLYFPPERISEEKQTEGESEKIQPCYIHDHMGPLKFRISPTAFFQVNTLCAERLYSLAGDWAQVDKDTLLFDVCCGTGTIGLTLAHRAAMVVGIEMNQSAVKDAWVNAKLNGISNCVFVAEKAEDVIGELLKKYAIQSPESEQPPEKKPKLEENVATAEDSKETQNPKYSEVVAIVDPPRSGLHPTVLKTLRAHTSLKRLVYVSCNVSSLVANALELCTPISEEKAPKQSGRGGWGRNRGGGHNIGQTKQRLQSMAPSPPFKPVKVMAVDMFPHTNHCEVVMLFER